MEAGENRNMKITKQQLSDFLILNLGTILITIGIYFFKFPNNFSIGGVSGIAIVVGHYTSVLSPTMLTNILSISLLIVGFLVLGKGFGFMTAYSTILMSVLLQVLEIVYPMTEPFTNQPFLELVFAVLLPSVGSAMIFNIGGFQWRNRNYRYDFQKVYQCQYREGAGFFYAALDCQLAWHLGLKTGLYSLLGLVLKSFLD